VEFGVWLRLWTGVFYTDNKFKQVLLIQVTSLSECERRYSQTEREALALVWACDMLHPYVYGREFDLVTDHKALEAIYSPRSKPWVRIEQWVQRLQPYDFRAVHIPGKNNIADPLSHLIGKTTVKVTHGACEICGCERNSKCNDHKGSGESISYRWRAKKWEMLFRVGVRRHARHMHRLQIKCV
jgi:hypothetical protein